MSATPGRYLQPLKRTTTPRCLVIVDTETTERQPKPHVRTHTLRLGVARRLTLDGSRIVASEQIRFRRGSAFWAWLYDQQRARRTTWLVAHNAGFDLTVLDWWAELESRRQWISNPPLLPPDHPDRQRRLSQRPGFAVLGCPPLIVRAYTERGTIRIIDSMNYWPCSLAALGRSVGLVKPDLPDPGAPVAEWWARCEADVDIVQAAMLALFGHWHASQSGPLGPTAAACAWSALRAKHVPAKAIVRHTDADLAALERAAYYGGETYAWFRGYVERPEHVPAVKLTTAHDPTIGVIAGPVYALDVRSLYPSVMATEILPTKPRRQYTRPPLERAEKLARYMPAIATVRLATDQVFPKRVKPGRVIWACGEFTTTLAGAELRRAFRQGAVTEVIQMATYDGWRWLAGYVEEWWAYRLAALERDDLAGSLFGKMMLNSLHGKFGQRGGEWADRPGMPCPVCFGQWGSINAQTLRARTFRAVGWHAQERMGYSEGRTGLTAISAMIAAAARNRMWELRAKCPPGSVLYQATDSLVVTQPGMTALASDTSRSNEIGRLKRVSGPHDQFECWGSGDYTLSGIQTLTGRKKSARVVDPQTYSQWEWQSLGDSLSGTPDSTVRVIERDYFRGRTFKQGRVTDGGWVRPFEYSGGQIITATGPVPEDEFETRWLEE